MEKPTDKYKYKEAWQAMMKRRWRQPQPAAAAVDAVASWLRPQRPRPHLRRRLQRRLHPRRRSSPTRGRPKRAAESMPR